MRWLTGFRKTSTPGSNQRRLVTRATLLAGLVVISETILAQFGLHLFGNSALTGFAAAAWSIAYFVMIVSWVMFLTSQNYPPDATRLVVDILVSILLSVAGFSLLYRSLGIVDTGNDNDLAKPLDFLYFAAVTFSTLGYGDFRPAAITRIFAAIHAILGNLHLGFLVGAAFYAVQKRADGGNSPGQDTDDK